VTWVLLVSIYNRLPSAYRPHFTLFTNLHTYEKWEYIEPRYA
jgi:hypothetical protein